ncbi:MAG: hypothetical protein J6331_10265 [Lentisphaeria bacterium]|nr:hypothetical protein [Lentisphaeria bacterium]
MKSSRFSLFLVPLLLLSSSALRAELTPQEEDEAKKAYFESFRKKKVSKIPDLIITANYQSCAILAAIARKEKKTPCILLPAAGDRKGKIWFIPAKNSGILPLEEKELGRFISLLAPGRIIVLGDELVVPEKCRPLSGSERPSVSILSQNWRYNALILGNLLSIRKMQEKYDEAMKNNVTDPFVKGLCPPEKAGEGKKSGKSEKKK